MFFKLRPKLRILFLGALKASTGHHRLDMTFRVVSAVALTASNPDIHSQLGAA